MSAGVPDIDLGDTRFCTSCTTWKPRTWQHFFKDKDGPLGVSRVCKECDNSYQARRRAEIAAGIRVVKKRVTNAVRH